MAFFTYVERLCGACFCVTFNPFIGEFLMRYKYKTHSDIPLYMKDYLLSVVGGILEDVPVEDINNFLNGYEEWVDQGEMFSVNETYQDSSTGSVTIH
tara:strand:- start:404 stop:694 length:291 start_codon:yes stop_codon:yes gene_type:complete